MQDGPESKLGPDTSYQVLLTFVGIRIRQSRKLAKLSQKELAKAIGSGQSYIFRIETGEANPTLKTLVLIAAAVGLSPRDFLPQEHSNAIIQALHITMQHLDQANEQLRQIRKLIADEPNAHVPDVPSES